ncbi:hypothetical protein BJF78_10045 [Pseudonocardia sp. CNS-139]|nr:hypothetical protein BJF78_10045 [Pseudonocardia sp. CNS-139]
MANFVFAYHGGSGAPATPQEQEQVMAEWGAWFGALGSAVVDGGAPFGASSMVRPDGSTANAGAAGLGGYSVVTATDLAAATNLAKDCPVLRAGGSVDVYEVIPM